jgi:hypothetical protein
VPQPASRPRDKTATTARDLRIGHAFPKIHNPMLNAAAAGSAPELVLAPI